MNNFRALAAALVVSVLLVAAAVAVRGRDAAPAPRRDVAWADQVAGRLADAAAGTAAAEDPQQLAQLASRAGLAAPPQGLSVSAGVTQGGLRIEVTGDGRRAVSFVCTGRPPTASRRPCPAPR